MVMLLSFTGGWGEGECAEGQTESSYTAHTGADGWEGEGGEGVGLCSVLATVVELHCDTYPSSHKQNYVGCVM